MKAGMLKYLKCAVLAASVTALVAGCGEKDAAVAQAEKKDVAKAIPAPGIAETKAIAEEAYSYGFPMIAAYKATYPLAKNDGAGQPLDGSKHDYTLTFVKDQFPPVNAFWSLTLYIQNKSPGNPKESNWLPAPDGPIYMVMRLYWPKDTPPSILPPGEGTWIPPAVIARK